MAPKKTLLERFRRRITEDTEETMEKQPTTLHPDADLQNPSVPAPEVQEDNKGPRGATQVRGMFRSVVICFIVTNRDDPVSREEGAAGPTSTFSEHVHAQPPMMHDDPVTQQEWASWPPTYSQHVSDLPDVQPPMTNDEQAPPIGHFEEDITTAADPEDPNSMVRAIKEREDRRPGLYDQSPYVREKPTTIPDKQKAVEPATAKWVCKGQLKGKHNAIDESFLETCGSVGSEPDFENFEFANGLVIRKSHILNLLYGCMTEDTATTVRRMLKEYRAFPDDAKWELQFDTTCPQQASGSLNCAIFVVKYIEALIRRKFPGWTFNEDDCNLFRARFAALLLEFSSKLSHGVHVSFVTGNLLFVTGNLLFVTGMDLFVTH
ncbi:hypothetical protein Taro_046878 [Colocasia esculenta]|uniref:Ubiquitin-like protease family profile domain-containing protein n=1 Tax=Colocasia esculenta TaxID=4460 RepID=A0A843X4Q5_COLES|nr:hypothetical protein [Colocasia esculenta]